MMKKVLVILVLSIFASVAAAEAWQRRSAGHGKQIHGRHPGHQYRNHTQHPKRYHHRQHFSRHHPGKTRSRAFHRYKLKRKDRHSHVFDKQYRRHLRKGNDKGHVSSNNRTRSHSRGAARQPDLTPSPDKPTQAKPTLDHAYQPDSWGERSKHPTLQQHAANSRVWIPARKEKVWVPGYWSYGIRKVWREDHWRYETDPDARKWVDGYYDTQIVEPGYFISR